MDEDAKTMLAILALVYGSSNGIGLLKDVLDPVKKHTDELNTAIKSDMAAPKFIRGLRNTLILTLFNASVVCYVLLVLVAPCFLGVVVVFGPKDALTWIGLGAAQGNAPTPRVSFFYIILLVLTLVSAAHLLSAYLKGWSAVLVSVKGRKSHA